MFFKKLCRLADDDFKNKSSPTGERVVFSDCRIRYSGGFDGNPRTAVVLPTNESRSEYGHCLIPGCTFEVGRLKKQTFIRIVGKFLIS